MNAIISVLINITLIFSFLFASATMSAQDFVNGQIDYAINLIDADDLLCFAPTFEEETTVVNFKNTSELTPEAITVTDVSDKEISNITPPKTKQMYGRESITFILGKDRNFDLPFYEEAFYYFANHPYDQTEFIITSCNSLLDVRNYLASFPTGNALPWSTINIVLSPNKSTNLSVPIFPQGTKSDAKNLQVVAMQNDFPSLTSNQIDQWTSLYIHGKSVEKDGPLNYALNRLLFSKESQAINPIFLDDTFIVEITK